MAREKDPGKRDAILSAAKRLFAERGFHDASVSDLARETGLPVGSIYTYFENKEAVFRTIIDEGWEDFFRALAEILDAADGPERKLSLIIYRVLPGLFEDVDLISLILAEAGRGVALDEKLERLAALIGSVVVELARKKGLAFDFPANLAMSALSVFFLGSLDTVRLARSAPLAIGQDDVIDFIRLAIENSFGISIERPSDP
jgi:AcrR family transcriptional regulator